MELLGRKKIDEIYFLSNERDVFHFGKFHFGKLDIIMN